MGTCVYYSVTTHHIDYMYSPQLTSSQPTCCFICYLPDSDSFCLLCWSNYRDYEYSKTCADEAASCLSSNKDIKTLHETFLDFERSLEAKCLPQGQFPSHNVRSWPVYLCWLSETHRTRIKGRFYYWQANALWLLVFRVPRNPWEARYVSCMRDKLWAEECGGTEANTSYAIPWWPRVACILQVSETNSCKQCRIISCLWFNW
jgi:hypothetical protein